MLQANSPVSMANVAESFTDSLAKATICGQLLIPLKKL